MKSLTLFNQPIRVGEDGMICLTDMWKASGKSDAESPYHYLRNKQTKSSWPSWRKTTNLWFSLSAVYTVEHMAEVCCLRLCGLVKPRVQVRGL
jgi:hypothetical protein